MTQTQDDSQYGYRKCWNVEFQWSPLHPKDEDLKPLRHTYDLVAHEALERLDELAPAPFANAPPEKGNIEGAKTEDGGKKKTRDLYELLEVHKGDEKVGRLWDEINTIPDWVDYESIERGQKIYWRYGGPALTSLVFLSLMGGLGSARVVETLDRTGGFGAPVIRRRLLETAQHTLSVHRDLAAMRPGGEGFVNSVRVRLLHGSVRRRILQMARERPAFFDVAELGAPISDLDSIGTIASFSAVTIWMGLPRQGIHLSVREQEDYMHLWRYVSYLMGVPHEWMADLGSSRRMMESILALEIKPSKKSASLANNMIVGLQGQGPAFASHEFMCAQCWWLNGADLSRALEIDEPSLYYRALIAAQCVFFVVTGYVNRSVPWLDQRNIEINRSLLYKAFVEDKSMGGLGYITRFNFKFLPDFDRISTERGSGKSATSGLMYNGVERTALIFLLFILAVTFSTTSLGLLAAVHVVGGDMPLSLMK